MKLIPLSKGYYSKVDDDMYDYLMQWSWYAKLSRTSNSYYATRNGGKADGDRRYKTIPMASVIMDGDTGSRVDHIDRDSLNNQRYNLRFVTRSQNGFNRSIASNSTSGYKGVIFCKSRNKWRPKITFQGKRYYCGRYSCKHDAARAWNLMSKKYHGEFGYQNIIID